MHLSLLGRLKGRRFKFVWQQRGPRIVFRNDNEEGPVMPFAMLQAGKLANAVSRFMQDNILSVNLRGFCGHLRIMRFAVARSAKSRVLCWVKQIEQNL